MRERTVARNTPECSKRPSSKAAASEGAKRTLRYVERLSEARTPLEDFFSILLEDIAKPAQSCYNKRPILQLIWSGLFVWLADWKYVTKQPPNNQTGRLPDERGDDGT